MNYEEVEQGYLFFKEGYYILEESLKLALSYFFNPGKRIHLLYLGSSMLLAFWVFQSSNSNKSFLNYLFPKRIWLSKSAFIDYSLFAFNSLVKILFIGPFVIFGFYLAFHVNEFMLVNFGFPKNSLGVGETLFWYTITLTIAHDFINYLVHFGMHRIPFLWEFHKVHHSATSLNPMTQYRIHPIELFINNIRSLLIFGIITGVFDYLSAHQIDKMVFLGVNVFHFAFLLLGANLRHSHVKLKYPKFLEYIFISPFQHQIHHSNNPDHFAKNMGSKLAIWDFFFGSLVLSKSVQKINFGISDESKKYNSFLKNLITPIKSIFNFLGTR